MLTFVIFGPYWAMCSLFLWVRHMGLFPCVSSHLHTQTLISLPFSRNQEREREEEEKKKGREGEEGGAWRLYTKALGVLPPSLKKVRNPIVFSLYISFVSIHIYKVCGGLFSLSLGRVWDVLGTPLSPNFMPLWAWSSILRVGCEGERPTIVEGLNLEKLLSKDPVILLIVFIPFSAIVFLLYTIVNP